MNTRKKALTLKCNAIIKHQAVEIATVMSYLKSNDGGVKNGIILSP